MIPIAVSALLSAAWVSAPFRSADAHSHLGTYPVRMKMPEGRSFVLASRLAPIPAEAVPLPVADGDEPGTAVAASGDILRLPEPEATPPASGQRVRIRATTLALDFDLARDLSPRERLEVKKELWVSGERVGQIAVLVEGNGTLMVRSSDLKALVPGLPEGPAEGSEEYVSFSRLREQGVDLRYDAARDTLIWNAAG